MIKLSASSIGTFDKCPKHYHYKYIEKPDVPKKDWSFLEFGKCAHRVLELFHEDLITNVRETSEYPTIMRDSFKEALTEFDVEILRDELSYLKEILQTYLNQMLRDGLPEVISNEMDFKIMVGDYLVRGFIDRIDKVGPGHYKVVDYKTNKNPKYLTNFQLLLYAIVIKDRFPDAEKISGCYVLLKHDCKTLDWEFTDKDIKRTINKILRTGKSIDTRDMWEKKPTALCNWCDYRAICQDSWSD
jgi:putative RecB family exonuclease